MKIRNTVGGIFAWVFALIALSLNVNAFQKELPNLSLSVTISDKSPKRTPLVWGDKDRLFVVYDIKNESIVPVTVNRLWFRKSPTVESVSVESGSDLVPAAFLSRNDYYIVGIPVLITVPVGDTWTVNVRGTVVGKGADDNYATASIDYNGMEFETRYDSYGISNPEPSFYHHIFDKGQLRQVISNTSGLERLENASAYGFTIGGNDRFSRSKVLIRIAGPALAALGVRDTLSDPVLTVFNSNRQIVGTADDWPIGLESEFRRLGAFPFARGSTDSALEVELPPGGYTVEVKSFPSTSAKGAYLIEVYQQ